MTFPQPPSSEDVHGDVTLQTLHIAAIGDDNAMRQMISDSPDPFENNSMGGFGSGRWALGCADLVEDHLALDVRALARGGHLRAGRVSAFRWPGENGRERAAVRLRAEKDAVVIEYRCGGEDRSERLLIRRTAVHFGARSWLVCPACGRRAAVLYFRLAGFACRSCLRLRYRSQYESPVGRAASRHVKASTKLGVSTGVFDDAPPRRPSRMWRRTFGARLDEVAETRDRWRAAVREQLRRLIEQRDRLLSAGSSGTMIRGAAP